ncbi:adenylate/guanylate cyclase domain-containing protein [Caenimonas terrae]|uniref:Adenylate/guanylate cyclase domain-containing protein n=1 Tax=Caenimonas terrae TaxID=696074 RepID=A0ABW0NIJ3_9BURK
MSASTDLPSPFARQTKVLMVMDVVESVRLMEQDENDFVARWQKLVDRTEHHLLGLHGGRLVKSLGDGLMLEFKDALGCIRAGFALQELAAQGNEGLASEQQLHLRIGAHLAEFVADKHDIYGSDVNLTARIAGLAGPGEFIITAELRDRLAPNLDADVEDLGGCYLKHVAEPVRVYRVGPPGHQPVIAPGQTVRLDLRPTIAIIPFSMRSSEPGQELLGEALADDVIAALSRTSELHVISRLSTTFFRGRDDSVDDIKAHLGASYVLSGVCRASGSDLALFVELIDTKTRHIVWADSLKGRVSGVFSADDELIARLVAAISAAVMHHEVGRAHRHALPTLEGYTLLLGAVALMHRNSPSDFKRSREMLEHLVERSRRHPAPHAWLATWHVLLVQQGWSDDPQAQGRQAMDSTRRALENDPQSSLALTVQGFVLTNLVKDLAGAASSYQAALQINPNESLAWLLTGTLNAFMGNGADALDASERALRLSPLDPLRYFYDSLAASAAITAGKYDRAIELAKRSLRANRSHTSTYRALAIAQSLSNQMDDARDTVQKLLELEPSFTVTQFLARTPARGAMATTVADALLRAGLPA